MADAYLLVQHPHFTLEFVLVLVLVQILLVLFNTSCSSHAAGAAGGGGGQRPWARKREHSEPRHDERFCSELVLLPRVLMLDLVLFFFLPLYFLLLQLLALALRGLDCCYCSRCCSRCCWWCCCASHCCGDAWNTALIGDGVQKFHHNSGIVINPSLPSPSTHPPPNPPSFPPPFSSSFTHRSRCSAGGSGIGRGMGV
jgi:hypothetical protein